MAWRHPYEMASDSSPGSRGGDMGMKKNVYGSLASLGGRQVSAGLTKMLFGGRQVSAAGAAAVPLPTEDDLALDIRGHLQFLVLEKGTT